MEGKNCFRTRWSQTPFYSGGNISLLTFRDDEERLADYIVSACENTINVVVPDTGAIIASFTSPIDDLILHTDAVITVGTPQELEGTDQSVPQGSFVAFSTRSLQIYVVEFVAKKTDTNGHCFELKLVRNWTAAQQAVSLVKFVKGGSILLTGSTDGNIKGWNVFHHHLTHNLRSPAAVITSMATSDDCSKLAVGNFEGWVTTFNFNSKQQVATKRMHSSSVEALCFQSEATLISLGRDRKISVADATSLSELRSIVIKEHVSCAVFEDAVTLHVGSDDGVLASYSVPATEEVRVMRRSARRSGAKSDDVDEEFSIRSLALRVNSTESLVEASVAPRPNTIFAATAAFNIEAMQRSDSEKTRYDTVSTLVGYLDQVLDVKPLADCAENYHRVVVTNSKDVRSFIGSGSVSDKCFSGHSDIVLCCHISTDGRLMATGSKDHSVRVWNMETADCLLVGADGHSGDVTAVAFNNKQSDSFHVLLSIGADDNFRMWDVQSALTSGRSEMTPKAAINEAHQGAVHCLAVAPNDQFIATGGKDKNVNVWNMNGKKIFKEAVMKGHRRGVTGVAFSPTDRVLASSSNDGSVRLWSLVSFSCVKTLQSDKVGVLQLHFFNKGTQLVTGNAEGVLRFWALAASEVVTTLESHSEKVWALAAVETEKDTFVLSGAADGVLHITEDFTTAEAQRLEEERHEAIYNEQELQNAMRKGNFSDAFRLALQLNHPRHLRQVVMRWTAVDSEECSATLIRDILPSLSHNDTKRLLEFTREWITNARHCTIATIITHSFLKAFHFSTLEKTEVFSQLLEALLSYSTRHSNRIHQVLHRTYYIDFLLKGTKQAELTTSLHTLEETLDRKRKREENE